MRNDPRKVFDRIRFADEFTVTNEHLKLLSNMYVSWDDCEFGAPAIDCKRPYGNSDVLGDIAEILGLPAPDEDTGDLPAGQEEAMVRMHAEMALVLQIGVRTGSFKTGRYVRADRYGENWKEADNA